MLKLILMIKVLNLIKKISQEIFSNVINIKEGKSNFVKSNFLLCVIIERRTNVRHGR